MVANGLALSVSRMESPPSRSRRVLAWLTALALPAVLVVAFAANAASLHTAEVGVAGGAVTVEQGGSGTAFLGFTAQGALSCTTGATDPPATITLDSHFSLDASGAVTSSEPATVSFTSDGQPNGGSDNCGVTWPGAPDPYVQAIRVSADPATPLGEHTIDVATEIANSPDTGAAGKLGGAVTRLTVTVVPASPVPSVPEPPVVLPQPPAQEVLGEQVAPLRPKLGKTVLLTPVSGRVLVRTAGRTVPLTTVVEVPNGTTVDATRGVVKVTVEATSAGLLQFAEAWAGGFKVKQGRGAAPMTVFHLAGALKASRARTASAARAIKKRSLWLKGKGSFSSRGRRASAIVRGTEWLVQDSAAGTRVQVRTGTVRVRDFTLRRDVLVRAGQSYLARERRATARRAPAFTGRARR